MEEVSYRSQFLVSPIASAFLSFPRRTACRALYWRLPYGTRASHPLLGLPFVDVGTPTLKSPRSVYSPYVSNNFIALFLCAMNTLLWMPSSKIQKTAKEGRPYFLEISIALKKYPSLQLNTWLKCSTSPLRRMSSGMSLKHSTLITSSANAS